MKNSIDIQLRQLENVTERAFCSTCALLMAVTGADLQIGIIKLRWLCTRAVYINFLMRIGNVLLSFHNIELTLVILRSRPARCSPQVLVLL